MTAPLIHLIYASTAADEPSPAELAELLRGASVLNEQSGVTGMLLYADHTFFQVLEGEAATVDSTFARITRDPRHYGAVTIIRERISRRAFGAWSMGFVADTKADLAALAGVNDFFAGASCFNELPDGRAKKILAAFNSGRWRTGRAVDDRHLRRSA